MSAPNSLSFDSKPKQKRRFKVFAGVMAVVTGLTAGGISWYLQKEDSNKQNSVAIEADTERKLPTGNIVIFEKTVCLSEEIDSKCTVSIFRTVNGTVHEKLAVLKDINRREKNKLQYILNPDKKTLLIGQAEKLFSLDLASKKIETLLTAEREFQAIIFSPNGNQLFLWDQKAHSEDYCVHIYDLRNMSDKIIDQGQTDEKFFSTGVWRKDNKVLLAQQEPHFSNAFYFDIDAVELFAILSDDSDEAQYFYEVASGDGSLMTIGATASNFQCDGPITNNSFSAYLVFDPISLEEMGRFGDKEKITYVVSFSPDNSEVLYFNDNPTTQEECNQRLPESYFIYNVKNKTTHLVADYQNLLREWSDITGEPFEAFLKNDYQKIIGESNIHIIARYLQQ